MADSSNLDALLDALVALVSGTSGTANVKKGRRLTFDWGTFVNQFQEISGGAARVNGWTVAWKGQAEERATSLENKLVHRFWIEGYYSVREPATTDTTTSEAEFDALILAVCDQIRTTHDLSGLADLSAPAQVPEKDERLFGGVLCHYCKITFTADEWLAGD